MFPMSSSRLLMCFVANKRPCLGVWASQVFLLRQQGKGNSAPVQDVVLVTNRVRIRSLSQHLSNVNTNLRTKIELGPPEPGLHLASSFGEHCQLVWVT